MKKLIALSLALVLLVSCSLDDNDNDNYSFEILSVESVDIPTEFTLGETYPITVTYLNPSTCHVFREFYYSKNLNERTVAPITLVYENDNCQTLENVTEDATFNFVVTSNGSYIFKFWQGEDENGEDQYLIIEVPVTE
ncbi:hypothetical protein EV196_101626 [Mariniflexile fucanivorans]|uniref:Lipoprotein n=1 Tax=Mariniflexile fucanivorans TaxID=264023 RepID=A0A4R1RT88_9FLAO|nr:hypothetical protein [Mariniflexile fucanivorans]TCL69192.1 hypothetical protein EV196_101626 [Mariniflexile fucanivorans]